MSERQRVYRDADGVRRTLLWDDEHPDEVTVHTEQVLDEVLDSIERDRATMRHDGVNKLLARIPVSVYEQSVHEQWDEADWRRYLNSSEAAPFRIWRGTV